MTPELKEYLAFISYQRKDEETARWLHHQLEHYQVPINIIESQPELMKLSRKVFLDSVELSSGILSEEIDRALNMSRFLIVICSPNSAQSPWVDKEIRCFLALNGPYSVIPFIIAGVPYSENRDEECFAPALIELRNTSAEILGINISEYGREVASVKVMAYMLGLKFDSLWQRYEREKEQEYRRLEEERNRLLRLQSLFLAEKSLAELSDGNLANARYLALKALPRNVENPDRPLVEEAEIALRKAMNSREMCMQYPARINSALFNQDSKMIIAGGECRTLTWRRIPDGAEITSIPKMSRILKVRSSSDGSLLIVSTYKGNVLIYEKNGELIKAFKNHGTPICDAVLSHDNSRLYVATAKGRLYVYDFVSSILLYKIEAHEGKITSLALSSSDTWLASASLDGKVKVWKTAIMEQACCYDEGISQVGFNPMDDTLLISSGNGSIRILDILNNEIKWENTVSEKSVSSIAFSDDGKEIAYGSKYGVVCILDAETGKTRKIIKCHDDMITSVAFNTSCSLLLTASADKTVKVNQLKDSSLPELKKFDFAAAALSVNADKTISAAISQNGIPILFNLATGNYDKLNVRDVRFSNLCIGHNTPLLAALSKESSPRLWLLNTLTMNVSHTINLRSEYGAWINDEETSDSFVEKPKDAVSILSFSPDDKLIAILIGEKSIGLYSVTNCRLIRKLSGFKSNIKSFLSYR